LGASELITDEERCKLCQAAIKEQGLEELIAVSKGEIEYEHGFVDFNEVSVRLAEFLNLALRDHEILSNHPLQVVYVCGLDHFNKCPYVEQLASEKNMACAIIYRPDASEHRIKTLPKSLSNFYYIKSETEGETLCDVSSTALRQYYRSGNNIDVHQSSFSCVADYYKAKYSTKQ
jgi:hypothetical protein